jgi:hypothetical protein
VGDLRTSLESGDRLAGYAAIVPAARDTGKRVGNHRFLGEKGTRFSKGSSTSLASQACEAPQSPGPSISTRNRQQGKKHTQALIALARRKKGHYCVLWAMLRDGTTFGTRSVA